MKTKHIFQTLLASTILLALVAPTQATPITIFNTGVDGFGVSRLDNDLELHYSLIAPSPTIGTPFVTTSTGGFPVPPWLANSTISAWIAPTASTNDVTGSYTYQTTFDLTGFDPLTALLGGRWSTDNNGLDILINGTPTGHTTGFGDFGIWTSFSITSDFIAGINTLDFVLNNGGGPTGLRVEFVTATADLTNGIHRSVPAPASLALLGIGLVGLGVMRRRKC